MITIPNLNPSTRPLHSGGDGPFGGRAGAPYRARTGRPVPPAPASGGDLSRGKPPLSQHREPAPNEDGSNEASQTPAGSICSNVTSLSYLSPPPFRPVKPS